MISALIRSNWPFDKLLAKIQSFDALLVEPSLTKSKEQLVLAYHLANKSFKQKTNIARDFKLEFLLWLTGKRDIKSATQAANPKGKEMFLIIFDNNEKLKRRIIAELDAKELKFKFAQPDPITIENISLSRV